MLEKFNDNRLLLKLDSIFQKNVWIINNLCEESIHSILFHYDGKLLILITLLSQPLMGSNIIRIVQFENFYPDI